MSKYETIYSGGPGGDVEKWMTVYLYPWSSDEKGTCEKLGDVATALRDAGEELVDHGAITYYDINRFRAEDYDYNYPEWGDIDDYSYGEIEDNFRDYLDDTTSNDDSDVPSNGSGANLYSLTGVHQLIHGGYTGCNETSGYAPAGAGAEHWGNTAFSEGRVAWSPVCSDDGLEKNAAIQECTHMFCGHDADDQWEGGTETKSEDQHTLGKVIDSSSGDNVTPMLTYHWDENITDRGDCPSYSTDPTATGYEQSMTYCTKEAIKATAEKYS